MSSLSCSAPRITTYRGPELMSMRRLSLLSQSDLSEFLEVCESRTYVVGPPATEERERKLSGDEKTRFCEYEVKTCL